jgi:hypothetical protein
MTAPITRQGAPWSSAPPRQLVFVPRGRRELVASLDDGVPCLVVELPSSWRANVLSGSLVLAVTLALAFTLMRLAITGQTGLLYWVCLGIALIASFAALLLGQLLGGHAPISFRAADGEGQELLTVRRRVTWNPVAFRRTVRGADGGQLGAIVLRWSSWRVQDSDGRLAFTARDPELLTVHLRPRSTGRREPLALRSGDGHTVATANWSTGDGSFTLDAERTPADAFALVLAWAVLADQALRR